MLFRDVVLSGERLLLGLALDDAEPEGRPGPVGEREILPVPRTAPSSTAGLREKFDYLRILGRGMIGVSGLILCPELFTQFLPGLRR